MTKLDMSCLLESSAECETMCIYLLHGFASAPKLASDKADILEKVLGLQVKQLSYDSAASYHDNIAILKAQVDAPPLFFVGTSLGAFYASRLAELFHAHNAMPIMLNPCHNPSVVLNGSIGENINFSTGEHFTLTASVVASYRNIPLINESMVIPRWILLNMDDELIDAAQTAALYEKKLAVICFKHGGHRFKNIVTGEVIKALEQIDNSYFIHSVAND